MMFVLTRDAAFGNGVFGKLVSSDGLDLETLENAHTLIPPGVYTCKRDWYHRGDYETFEIQVAGRSRLLLHAANYPFQLEGCIAPGMERAVPDGVPAVWRSRYAHGLYMAELDGIDEHLLQIVDAR